MLRKWDRILASLILVIGMVLSIAGFMIHLFFLSFCGGGMVLTGYFYVRAIVKHEYDAIIKDVKEEKGIEAKDK